MIKSMILALAVVSSSPEGIPDDDVLRMACHIADNPHRYGSAIQRVYNGERYVYYTEQLVRLCEASRS